VSEYENTFQEVTSLSTLLLLHCPVLFCNAKFSCKPQIKFSESRSLGKHHHRILPKDITSIQCLGTTSSLMYVWSSKVKILVRSCMSSNFSRLSTSWILNYTTLTEYFRKCNTTQGKVFAFWSADLNQAHSLPSTEIQSKTVPLLQASFQVQVENLTKLET